MHYFAKVNDLLAAVGGPALEVAGLNGGLVSETAKIDFFIRMTGGNKVYSSGIGNDAQDPLRPAFNFTDDLLNPVGPSAATPLPAGSASALSFLADAGFQVWGLEDSPTIQGSGSKLEPDYNDRIFAFRIVPVPEPSTYGLLGAGALAALALARRLRRSAVPQA